MVQLNFLDANGNVVHNLPNLDSINLHFNNGLDISSPNALLMDLITNHFKVTLNGVEYQNRTSNISNSQGTIKITYEEVV